MTRRSSKTTAKPRQSPLYPKKMKQHIFGVHLSFNQNLTGIIKRAQELKLSTFQIFGGNPRQWRSISFAPENIRSFKRSFKKAKVKKFFLHSIYLINLASKNDYIYQNSIDSLINFMQKAKLLGAEGVITHIGSAREHQDGESARARVVGAINEIIVRFSCHSRLDRESINRMDSRFRGNDSKPLLILENTAWGEGELGSSLEGLAGIYKLVKNKSRVGFCLDTAHLFEAGYNLKTKSGLDNFLQSFDRIIGLNKIRVIHLNDSKTKLNSKHDRHEIIGQGELGEEAISLIINHPKLISLPMILETPDLKNEGEIGSLNLVRKIAE